MFKEYKLTPKQIENYTSDYRELSEFENSKTVLNNIKFGNNNLDNSLSITISNISKKNTNNEKSFYTSVEDVLHSLEEQRLIPLESNEDCANSLQSNDKKNLNHGEGNAFIIKKFVKKKLSI